MGSLSVLKRRETSLRQRGMASGQLVFGTAEAVPLSKTGIGIGKSKTLMAARRGES
jgi:hypothetical protein